MIKRLPAEWEKQSFVQLTFPHKGTDWVDILDEVLPCFIEIAKQIARFQRVLIVCQSKKEARRWFSASELEQISFIEVASNDTWARDHGGITMMEGNNIVVYDFVFNGWGLKFPAFKDNLITRALYRKKALKGMRIKHGGLVMEGGGLESDGQGTLLTTAACLLSPNRNPHLTQVQLERKLKAIFGLERILWLYNGYLAGDDTDSHIDTLARFCTHDTIMYVQCLDKKDEHYTALLAMEHELKAFTKADGTPYNLVPLPMADACFDRDGDRLPATYANFLIINGAVLVPLYGVTQDMAVMSIFKTVFPNREIVGINCRPLILQHGSLHCVTMQYY